ncbi:DUF1642 domain-containing protein [Lacticaseibacillus paracasei subsp. paracasei]|uniref:DUF1642 domain-containing protein n=1 Tax=Lacticaseibacillus paracasei TaxID=1597 RepID=UPI001E3AF602|nr:DUF1642 domain-containing protein [Lacticaseibacillus paracasei]MCD0433090.1 DUF1642 domain-containing protein [Lacticaseibacillus paracasei subsp. paracasei]
MSEEKLYAVKNDNGEWSDDSGAFYPEKKNGVGFIFTMFSDRDEATGWAERNTNGGHVVTLIEEPKKVVLTKEQVEIVEGTRDATYPASYISNYTNSHDCEENLLINAYVNGYTMAKEKKYNVKVPHTSFYYWKKLDGGLSINDLVANDKYDAMKFTEAEIEHYGLQDCEKKEVTDNAD